MKTILEIFYVRIVGNTVRYRRKTANLSRKGGDPDRRIGMLLRERHRGASGGQEEREFIVHSTSWRYTPPDRIMLTYVAYSDELDFGKGMFKSLPLRKLGTITRRSRKPRSQAELERKVVSHAMRHIAFLIQEGDRDDFKSALRPQTVDVFERLWVSLAGRVFSETEDGQ